MNMRVVISAIFLLSSFGIATQAQEVVAKAAIKNSLPEKSAAAHKHEKAADNAMDELDPFDPNIEDKLDDLDAAYEEATGRSPFLWQWMSVGGVGCERAQCAVWLQVVKSQQKAYLFLDGKLAQTWKTSTGIAGRSTPNFDTHPNGRIYDQYTSTKFPGGDYKGLGNMPYAVFIDGGFAVHGTGENNWKKLGHAASHGCIRIHPDNALMFNRLVRAKGIYNVWITVQ